MVAHAEQVHGIADEDEEEAAQLEDEVAFTWSGLHWIFLDLTMFYTYEPLPITRYQVRCYANKYFE